MRVVDTPRLLLEPQVAAHAADMFAVLSDPAIYEFENEPPRSEQWLRERFARLESRKSPDGTEQWLNWVVRLKGGGLVGYVQATVLRDRTALIAYELASRHWRQGIGSSAVSAMLDELAHGYRVHTHAAMFKRANYRSRGLLLRLGFEPAEPALAQRFAVPPDESLMYKPVLEPRHVP